MARRKPTLTGPMSLQPVEHQSIQIAQSTPMKPATNTQAAPPKKQPTPDEALRTAKARIVRLNSLRKQRKLQKG
jgi:hypothetical protein